MTGTKKIGIVFDSMFINSDILNDTIEHLKTLGTIEFVTGVGPWNYIEDKWISSIEKHNVETIHANNYNDIGKIIAIMTKVDDKELMEKIDVLYFVAFYRSLGKIFEYIKPKLDGKEVSGIGPSHVQKGYANVFDEYLEFEEIVENYKDYVKKHRHNSNKNPKKVEEIVIKIILKNGERMMTLNNLLSSIEKMKMDIDYEYYGFDSLYDMLKSFKSITILKSMDDESDTYVRLKDIKSIPTSITSTIPTSGGKRRYGSVRNISKQICHIIEELGLPYEDDWVPFTKIGHEIKHILQKENIKKMTLMDLLQQIDGIEVTEFERLFYARKE